MRRSRGERQETPPPVPESNTPWEELYREKTGQLSTGAVAGVRGQISRNVKQGAAAQSLNRQLEHRRGQHVVIVEIDDRIVGPGIAHAARLVDRRRQSATALPCTRASA